MTETSNLGTALTGVLLPGFVIYLHGDLGTGKTALTRALLHGAGYQGHVKSPTYSLVETYTIYLSQQEVNLIHFDLYRVLSPDEFLENGFHEYFDRNTICVIEWPEKAAAVLPLPDINISLSVSGKGRDVKLEGLSDKGSQCIARMEFAKFF